MLFLAIYLLLKLAPRLYHTKSSKWTETIEYWPRGNRVNATSKSSVGPGEIELKHRYTKQWEQEADDQAGDDQREDDSLESNYQNLSKLDVDVCSQNARNRSREKQDFRYANNCRCNLSIHRSSRNNTCRQKHLSQRN